MTAAEYNICVEQYSDNVFRFILKNIRNEDYARDIVQDSFEKVWRNHSNITFSKAKSYIFSTAYHTMIDNIRKDKRKGDFEMAKEPSHNEQYSDLHEVLNEAIDYLPEIQKNVLLLRDYEGYSYKEIGEITELNESQVKVYIYRARLFLKNYIGNLEVLI